MDEDAARKSQRKLPPEDRPVQPEEPYNPQQELQLEQQKERRLDLQQKQRNRRKRAQPPRPLCLAVLIGLQPAFDLRNVLLNPRRLLRILRQPLQRRAPALPRLHPLALLLKLLRRARQLAQIKTIGQRIAVRTRQRAIRQPVTAARAAVDLRWWCRVGGKGCCRRHQGPLPFYETPSQTVCFPSPPALQYAGSHTPSQPL